MTGRRKKGTEAVRVAVYTRKSVERGLEQEFNSLDAQRQAVEGYVASQKERGWVALPERYDDGGFTGGNTDRPAFKRLLSDIEAGKVDCVAVYRADRLSRSLLDFARIIDHFERHEVTFVSITEQFDTTRSTGRLFLNMLMSFAEFERETISERTRDKIQATKRKGLWTGGPTVLGYDSVEKRLVVNEAEAEVVREIFRLYLDLVSTRAVAEELNRRGLQTKGRPYQPAHPWRKEDVRRVLHHPLYLGLVRAGEELVPGQHEAIVDQGLWDAVHARLRGPRKPRRRLVTSRRTLLQGLVRCAVCGSAMVRHYSSRKARRYAYYSCVRYRTEGAAACPGSRVPVGKLEASVVAQIRGLGRDPRLIRETIAALKKAKKARVPALTEAVRRLEKDVKALEGERGNVVEAIAKGGSNAALLQKVGEVEVELQDVRAQLATARGELATIESQRMDEDDLRRALESFDPVWDELFPAEQARILELLIERVTYDAREGEVEITLRPGGVRTLAKHTRKETA